ncbi:MAG: hypothetical protein RDU14_00965 [Melioribacteraceae bacterium]|nr:hypothetical protein [Melioribacteraceae bacterium]
MLIANAITLLYIYGIIYLFAYVKIWEASLIKDTIIWILFLALPMSMKAVDATKDDDFFKNLFMQNIKVILIIEFIINLYVFNLIIELLLVPFFVFIGALSGYIEVFKEHLTMKKVVEFILGMMGLIIISFFFYKMINDFSSFANWNNLRSFLITPLFSIAFIPIIYFYALFVIYENTFMRIKYFCKDQSLITLAKWKILINCNIYLRKAKRLSKELHNLDYSNKKSLIISINSISTV